MMKGNFTPKTDIEEYFNNEFNIEIFEELSEDEDWQGTFEPLEFLNLLYEQFEIVKTNKDRPLSVSKHLLGLKLEGRQFYYLLYNLKSHLKKYLNSQYPKDKQLTICREFIVKEFDKLEEKLFPNTEAEPQSKPENRYDFNKVKEYVNTLTSVKEKILYLTEIKTDYLQNKDSWFIEMGTSFDRKCELEIIKLNDLLKLEGTTNKPSTKPVFKLSDKTGAKTNLIRVLNALYELRLIDKVNGQVPTKQEFIEALGETLGVDLSKYHINLSQALKNQPLEVNLRVFEDMKLATQNAHYTNESK